MTKKQLTRPNVRVGNRKEIHWRDQFPMIPQEGESTCLSYASAIALRLWMPAPYPVEITILARDSREMIYTNPI
jgi:hypothetical protein